MKIAGWACWALVSCCVAASAATVAPAASAADGGEFDPAFAASAVEAVRKSSDGVAPACQVGRPSALVDGQVRIRLGETLCVRLQVVDGRPVPVALVGAADLADALVITMSLNTGRTFLILKNPLADWLRYRAYMRVGAGELRYTSSCPVMSKHRMAFEDWPYAIDEFVLSGFAIEPDPETSSDRQVSCR